MHLKENLLRGVYAYVRLGKGYRSRVTFTDGTLPQGFESPSAVQSRGITQICRGRDTIAQAQSGTGKTATFSIAILQVIDTAVRETQGKSRDRSLTPFHTSHTFQRSYSPQPANSPPRFSPCSSHWATT